MAEYFTRFAKKNSELTVVSHVTEALLTFSTSSPKIFSFSDMKRKDPGDVVAGV